MITELPCLRSIDLTIADLLDMSLLTYRYLRRSAEVCADLSALRLCVQHIRSIPRTLTAHQTRNYNTYI